MGIIRRRERANDASQLIPINDVFSNRARKSSPESKCVYAKLRQNMVCDAGADVNTHSRGINARTPLQFSPIYGVGCFGDNNIYYKNCVWHLMELSGCVSRFLFQFGGVLSIKNLRPPGVKNAITIYYIYKKGFRAEHAINFPPLYGNFQR
jgi:hypothetical protein